MHFVWGIANDQSTISQGEFMIAYHKGVGLIFMSRVEFAGSQQWHKRRNFWLKTTDK